MPRRELRDITIGKEAMQGVGISKRCLSKMELDITGSVVCQLIEMLKRATGCCRHESRSTAHKERDMKFQSLFSINPECIEST
jgi:hypothetical protein